MAFVNFFNLDLIGMLAMLALEGLCDVWWNMKREGACMCCNKKYWMLFLATVCCLVAIGSVIKGRSHGAHQCVITSKDQSRLGDQILSYATAKWLSYKYAIPFIATKFNGSESFVIDRVDRCLDDETQKSFKQIIEVTTEDELIAHLRSAQVSTLLIVSYSTGLHYPVELVANFQWPDMYTNMYFYSSRHPQFRDELKKGLVLKNQPKAIKFPEDRISVAVHVRKGSGGDTEQTSVQYADEWAEIIAKKIKKPYLIKGTDMYFPLKLPPEQFYVDQIIRLSQFLNNQPLFVYIFTDDKNPQQIVGRFKQRIKLPNIEFACEQTDAAERHAERMSIIDDIYNMARCDCLIKPSSGLSLISQFIGDHKVVIYPQNSTIMGDSSLNQVIIRVDNVSIIINRGDGKEPQFHNLSQIKEEQRKQVNQIFANSCLKN